MVSEVQGDVDADHQEVQKVEVDDVVVVIEEFMDQAREVADFDDKHEEQTFALSRTRYIGFIDTRRPGGSETDQHNSFENTHVFVLSNDIFNVRRDASCLRKMKMVS